MLSNSNLQSYLQCRRKLWIEHHRPDLAAAGDNMIRRREMDGNLVGEMSRAQLGKDFIWPPGHDDKVAAAEEAKLLLSQSPDLSAAEVPMVHGGLYARADALVADGAGYVLRETKASSFPQACLSTSTPSICPRRAAPSGFAAANGALRSSQSFRGHCLKDCRSDFESTA